MQLNAPRRCRPLLLQKEKERVIKKKDGVEGVRGTLDSLKGLMIRERGRKTEGSSP